MPSADTEKENIEVAIGVYRKGEQREEENQKGPKNTFGLLLGQD